ncbi:MAG: FHA domain-containing protein [Bryobacteraceae bacterium]|nr:FHA domain-containing protein [Bryobacteraceae bacterium]
MPQERSINNRQQVSGDDIIAEILRNADDGQFRMRKTVVLPSVFHVYLHPADHDLIRPVQAALRAEARLALQEQTATWNRKAQPTRIGKLLGIQEPGAAVTWRILDPDYTIEFFPDVENSLERGDVEVRSDLASAPPPDFDGAMTRQITRKNGTVSFAESTPAPAATQPVSRPTAAPTAGTVIYGWLRYANEGIDEEFPITKNEIAIGRGGKTVWVDVRLNAPADVSREHCRIRRDASGRFFINDLSQFGTTVDGRKLPSAQAGGTEVELPPRATISLAGVVAIQWEKA